MNNIIFGVIIGTFATLMMTGILNQQMLDDYHQCLEVNANLEANIQNVLAGEGTPTHPRITMGE